MTKARTLADFNTTSIPASVLTGTLPALNGSALTNLPAGGKIVQTKMEGNYNWSSDQSSTSTTMAGFGNEITITPTSSTNALLFYMSITDVYVPQSHGIEVGIKDKTNNTWVQGNEARSFKTELGTLGGGLNAPMTLISVLENAGSGERTYQGFFKSVQDGEAVYINNGSSGGAVRFCIMEVVKDD